MKRCLFALLLASLALTTASPAAAELAEARIFIEFNDTAQDVGVHMFLDGQWRSIRISDPRGRVIFEVEGLNALGAIGLSELFVEGEEPSLAELSLEELFSLFPAGLYTFSGVSEDGQRIESKARFSHRIPEGVEIVSPQEGVPQDRDATIIDWEAPTGPAGVQIAGYEVIVEGHGVQMSAKVPAWLTRFRVPPELLRSGRDYRFEVIAIEKNGNQTVFEGDLATAE